MSFNAFKEALRPCKTNSSSSSSSSSQIQIPLEFDSSVVSRKPPKSSLTRQLLRLQEDTACRPQIQLKSLQRELNLSSSSENDGNSKREEEKGKESGQEDPKVESLRHLDHTGPYEPLVLSLPGEVPAVQVPASVNSRLLEHQREGVKFLYNLYRNNHGGILGDDMGLGKTIQTIAFLAAVFGKGSEPGVTPQKGKPKKGPVLIICPSSVILNWESEFSKWSTFSVSVYHGPNRDLIMDKLEANDVEILITSFDTYRIQGSILSDIQWEIVVIDEAHRLKNEKSKLYIECLKIKTLKRYGLTGTIMQNKIMELFNLFDLVVPGKLGTREHFREFYDEPLKHGQRSSAPLRFIQVANERKEHLLLVLRKYMLRRTKEETIGHLMMGKEDNVVFCAMIVGALLNKLNVAKGQFQTVLSGLYLHRENLEGCDSCPFCLVLPCLVKLQQDCKKFQGELFGICNLFRDLSDKLFTSEILEFDENEGKEYNRIHTAELDLTELGIDFDPQEKTASGKSVVNASNDPKDKRKIRLSPVLEDLGVVYAHRNEDIVNFGSGIHVEGKPSMGLKEDVNQPCSPAEERKESDANEDGGKENSEVSDSSKRRKSDHSSLLALLMGMEEVELNKLLLSDPPECLANEVQIPNG
ncbi:UNVERIFIED_CONTAM: Switch 2 [Sesamum radiatum]|uniref:Switch 2 n=1 Tax=Sesamum radiatum TaxID=300843 RepID=A0AAW2LNW9_SESRA